MTFTIKTAIEVCAAILPSIASYIPKIVKSLVITLHKVAETIEAVAEVFDVPFPEKTEVLGSTEVLGAKAIQAEEAGHSPENPEYETYDDYVSFLNDFEIDEEKAEKIPEEERLSQGLAVKIQQIDELKENKFSSLFPEIFRAPDYFNSDRVGAILNTFTEGAIAVQKITGYLDSKLSSSEDEIVEDKLVQAEKLLAENKEKSDSEIRDNIEESRRC